MREEILQARGDVEFPADCDAETVSQLLNGQRLYDWSWSLFIRDLPYLYELLTNRPAVFDYLFVTRFLVARASHLLRTGPFATSFPEVWGGICRHKLQYAATYRHLFLRELEIVLKEGGVDLKNGGTRLFLTRILNMEEQYLCVVESVELIPDTAVDFNTYPMLCWVGDEAGEDSGCSLLIPPSVDVPARIEEYLAYTTVRPCKMELATARARRERDRRYREIGRLITPTDRDLWRMHGRKRSALAH